jgi:hypothetical protein
MAPQINGQIHRKNGQIHGEHQITNTNGTYWYPKGDINDTDAISISQYDMSKPSAPGSSAACIATGNIHAAAAVFVTILLIKIVAKYTAPYKRQSINEVRI